MHRAIERADKIDTRKGGHLTKMLPKANRFVWFKDHILSLLKEAGEYGDKTRTYSKDEMLLFAREFLQRNDETVKQLRASLKPNRQLLPKDVLFIDSVAREKLDAATIGVEMPNLSDSKNIDTLLSWDGDVNSITLIKSTNIIVKNI
ncbi:hypothetical protein AYI70_g6701 [Smittium culicis]|uniref:Uncharacterized protein n=1 Tax=Smittium culicis TaxID=133412 RepID=A0A1R1WXJ9_9FUNG|nr:hypothetical protein AYI70_g12429 [Smittium culicis]OMJ16296.1 hypothetical protein AYI70_g6701 [Smittium culicis]